MADLEKRISDVLAHIIPASEIQRRADVQEPPNLDAMNPGDLRAFFHDYHKADQAEADRRLGKWSGNRTALLKLTRYALIKADAMDARIAGKVQKALMLEGSLDRMYDQLPKRARW